MSDKETYKEKMQTQLDEWKVEIGKLKEKAAQAGEQAGATLSEQVKVLEGKIQEGKKKLDELAGATEEAWESVKQGVESLWASVKNSIKETADKLKKE
jgi:hypothetical protein